MGNEGLGMRIDWNWKFRRIGEISLDKDLTLRKRMKVVLIWDNGIIINAISNTAVHFMPPPPSLHMHGKIAKLDKQETGNWKNPKRN